MFEKIYPRFESKQRPHQASEERVKVVITDHRFPDVQQEQRAVEQAGGTLVVAQTTDEQQLIQACGDADAVLNVRAQVTRRVIESMQRCRIIVRYGIGVDTVDIPAATERSIMVANVPDYCVDEVSDHALTLLLTLSRQMNAAISLAREDIWTMSKMPPLHRLRGQTCGLLGCGKIGSLLAGKVNALGMRVIVCDPFLSEQRAREMGAELVSFDELLERSDFISLHAPLNEKTKHILGKQAFPKMKKNACIINTARGGLIDEAALIDALRAGDISGAGLDVLESETQVTPVRKALVSHPKVVVTPHTAWLSTEARVALQALAIEEVLACLRGEVPYGLINREVIKS
jgi:D-3-phosphoglycerate dehydrogenase / 2-oxoglutarate reductase